MNELPNNTPGRKSRSLQRRLLIGIAALVTIIAIFYLEEDWRGKRAWDICKAELEAKGIVMDWEKYIPPSIPDDQNFYTASTNMAVRFKKAQTEEEIKALGQNSWLNITYQSNSFSIFNNTKTEPLATAVVRLVPLTTTLAEPSSSGPSLAARFDAPDTPQRIQDLLRKIVGRTAVGAAGFEFSERQISNLAPAQIVLSSDAPHSITDLESLVPKDLIAGLGLFQVRSGGTNGAFEIVLADVRVTTAADYLKWSDQFVPAFDEVREALKRPAAVLPGDYSEPYLIPIPNFVTLRAVAQTLAQRAQCHLLLGQPDQALADMTLIHDLCRILQKPPIGKPETLVESMINVAINGLYAATIGDGLRMHAWQQPQLMALQKQLSGTSLAPWVAESFRGEMMYSARFFETTPAYKISDVMSSDLSSGKTRNFLDRFHDPLYLYLKFAPWGWRYQNLAGMAGIEPRLLDAFNLEQDTISPSIFDAYFHNTEKYFAHKSPFKTLAAIAIPNFKKAAQTTAYNQTLVNEAALACALEGYHIKFGQYPETLDTLSPDFIKSLPHDIIGGGPLHYRRTDDAKYLLYSVGWNEKDDGGIAAPSKNGVENRDDGDWLWRN